MQSSRPPEVPEAGSVRPAPAKPAAGGAVFAWFGCAALVWLGVELAKPFWEAAIFSAALSVGVWPVAKILRAKIGRRASCLALAAGLILGVGLPASWAWNSSFAQIDQLIQAMPAQIQSSAATDPPWRSKLRSGAAAQLFALRGQPAWAGRVQMAANVAWAPLGLCSILIYFMLADGALGLAWLRRAFSGFGERPLRALDAGVLAFEQSAKACLWFGGSSAAILWLLFAWAGAPSPLALAVASACASMLPFIAPVMVAGIAVSLLGPGNTVGPLALLLIGAGGLGVANNIWRPKWVGDNAGLPMPIALLAMAGGALAWGPAGLLAGPGIAAAILAAARACPEDGDDPQ